MRVYPDSCVVIYLVENRGKAAAAIRSRLIPAEPLPEVVYTDLTRLECRVWPKGKGLSGLLAQFDEFFAMPGFRRVALDTTVFDLATDLRAQHGLKTPDALHLAAAVVAGCDEIWTNDGRFAKAAENRIRIVVFDQPN